MLNVIRTETGKALTYATVYNAWHETCASAFRSDADPNNSALNFLKESISLRIIYQNANPFAVAFTTDLGVRLCERHRIDEVFIGSTFKTIGQKLELFCVVGSLLGTGFPIAYMILSLIHI